MAIYTCRQCGLQRDNPHFAIQGCTYSPSKCHELMNATEKLAQYTCRYCGLSRSSPTFAIQGCAYSPIKKHELLG